MKYPPVVFIAGERQHAGKTTTSLGVISALCQHIDPSDIGYFKPVGQEMVTLSNGERIDKDVLVIKEFTDLDIQTPETLSPVRVVSGVTRNYIQSNNREIISKRFENAITKSFHSLSKKKLIIAEGTGHPGVGSVVGLSNARVANLLNARILYLVGGGIGRTLDELEVDLSYFEHHKSQVGGVLFNKVIPSKLEQMSSVLNEEAIRRIFCSWNPPLNVFGYMPQVDYLNNPSMELISLSFPSMKPLNGALNSESGKKPCRKVKIISQSMTTDYESTFAENDMMQLVGYDMSKEAARNVCEDSGIDVKDIDVVELHDCFAQNELITYEALGLCEEGEAKRFISDGDNTYGGKFVTNPSGGLLSKGHPLGATGLAQCFELTQQLRGNAGERQVEGARTALQHNLGLGGACVATIYQSY